MHFNNFGSFCPLLSNASKYLHFIWCYFNVESVTKNTSEDDFKKGKYGLSIIQISVGRKYGSGDANT